MQRAEYARSGDRRSKDLPAREPLFTGLPIRLDKRPGSLRHHRHDRRLQKAFRTETAPVTGAKGSLCALTDAEI